MYHTFWNVGTRWDVVVFPLIADVGHTFTVASFDTTTSWTLEKRKRVKSMPTSRHSQFLFV